jgi:hypothetical protein
MLPVASSHRVNWFLLLKSVQLRTQIGIQEGEARKDDHDTIHHRLRRQSGPG